MPVFAAVSPNRATGPIRDKGLNYIYGDLCSPCMRAAMRPL